MKPLKYQLLIAVIVFFSLFPLRATAQDDIRFIGEIHYEVYWYHGAAGPMLMERKPMQVISLGDQYFLFGNGETGTAFIKGNTLIITLYGSSVSGGTKESSDFMPNFESSFYIRYMAVDISTLVGIFKPITFQTKPEPRISAGGGDLVRIVLPTN